MERLPVVGDLLSDQGLAGPRLRAVRLNNAALEAVREQEDPLCTLLAETRWLTYQLGRKEYGRRVGIDTHAVQNSETTGTRVEHETHSAILRRWTKDEIAAETRRHLLELLILRARARREEAQEPATELDASTLTVNELYAMWTYAVGLQAFQAKADLTSGGLWQRQASSIVPGYREVRALAAALQQDADEARRVWTQDKLRQLEGRGVPAPIREFTVALEAGTKDFDLVPGPVKRALKCTEDVAKALCAYDVVPFARIEDAARRVIPAERFDDFEMSWRALEAAEAERDTFAKAFTRARDARKIDNRQLAIEMRIVAPEQREGAEDASPRRRREKFRPSSEIRRTLDENDYSTVAPAGVLIELVARPEVRVGEAREPEREYLRRLFLERLDEHARKIGSVPGRSPFRQHRQLWGMPIDALEADGWPKDALLEIESGRRECAEPEKLLEAIERKGMERAAQALERRRQAAEANERLAEDVPRTVAGLVASLRHRAGGVLALRARVVGNVDAPHEIRSTRQLRRVETGDMVPSLRSLRALLVGAGSEAERKAAEGAEDGDATLLEPLIKDWHLRFPDELATREKKPWTSPLARFFGVLFAEHESTLKRFWEARIEGVSYPTVTRNFQVLNDGQAVGWDMLSRYLDAADLPPGPRRRYAEILHAQGCDVGKALAIWRAEMREGDVDPAECEHLLGLTAAEREAHAEALA